MLYFQGNGSGFAAPIVRFVRGEWHPFKQEVVKPSLTSKLCFLAAVALVLIPELDVVYLSIVGLFLTVKLSTILAEPVDPIKPLENIFWGLLDALNRQERVKDD